jgi:PIN domain nuclease of toxin-antitoxin system
VGGPAWGIRLTLARYLLDTHAALWWWTDLPRLGRAARAILESGQDEVLVSAVSALEISLKWRLGKLDNIGDPHVHYPLLMRNNGFIGLTVSDLHGLRAGLLPGDHRDPFDRLIAAQALDEDVPVITRDREFLGFGCEVIW